MAFDQAPLEPVIPRFKGRPMAHIPSIGEIRELTAADIHAHNTTPLGCTTNRLKRLNDYHLHIVRLLAGGLSHKEVAKAAGCTLQTVAKLERDPLFQEALVKYRKIPEKAYEEASVDFAGRLAAARNLALQRLVEKLEANDETLTVTVITNALKELADRSGFGPKTTSVNVNVNLAERLEAARKRLIDITPENLRLEAPDAA